MGERPERSNCSPIVPFERPLCTVSTNSLVHKMVHEALRQWRERNCRGLRFDAAAFNAAGGSRDPTPGTTGSRRMAMDSPFNSSPMSPMLTVLDMMVSEAKTDDDIFDTRSPIFVDGAFESIDDHLLDGIDA